MHDLVYSNSERQQLIDCALRSIRQGLDSNSVFLVPEDITSPHLLEPRATFVTLKIAGQLRGCIGELEARQPLIQSVSTNAYRAAFKDPRFKPLSEAEFDQLEIDISVLSPATAIKCCSEADALKQLQPNTDGLILREDTRCSTFLPSVWQQLPNPKNFLRELKMKAGLDPDYWSDSIKLERYAVEAFAADVTEKN